MLLVVMSSRVSHHRLLRLSGEDCLNDFCEKKIALAYSVNNRQTELTT
jgi:hypothetical protein